MLKRSHLAFTLVASLSAFAPAAYADGAQTLYAVEAVSPAALSQGSLAWSEDERPLKLDSFFGLAQFYKAPGANTETLVNTPLCINIAGTAIGHAFAKKTSAGWKTLCRTANGDQSGTPLLKPTGQQLQRINFIPFTSGSPLPAMAAPIARGDNGVDLLVCRVVTKLSGNRVHIAVGTLGFDGKCVTAPGYLGAPASKEETSFELMVSSANAAPAVGWIYLKANGHHPRGTLVEWPNGVTYCQGRTSGFTSHGTLELNANGSVKGCQITLNTGGASGITQLATENIRVFRNDAQSNVGFGVGDDPSIAPVVIGTTEACVAYKAGTFQARGIRGTGSDICVTSAGPFSRKATGSDIRSLRRKGNWPEQG